MDAQASVPPSEEEREALYRFASTLIDEILTEAQKQFSSDADEKDEISLTVPLVLKPVANAPLGGCIEICTGLPWAQICVHKPFKGDRPGEG